MMMIMMMIMGQPRSGIWHRRSMTTENNIPNETEEGVWDILPGSGVLKMTISGMLTEMDRWQESKENFSQTDLRNWQKW